MIYDKNFFTGLALVVGGLVLGGVALSFSLGGVPDIAFDASFSESSASGSTACVQATCLNKECKVLAFDPMNPWPPKKPIAVKGQSLYYILPDGVDGYKDGVGGKHQIPPLDTLMGAAFKLENTTCSDTCRAGKKVHNFPDKSSIKSYEDSFCQESGKKATPTPTPTTSTSPKPGNKVIFACKSYKCWYNAFKDPKLPLATPDDPVFVDDTAVYNMFRVMIDDCLMSGNSGFNCNPDLWGWLNRRGTPTTPSQVCVVIGNNKTCWWQ